MIVVAEAWIYSVDHTIIRRHSGIFCCFINQLRILFVVFLFQKATCISFSLVKAAACLAMWSFRRWADATPHVMQSAFVCFKMSLIKNYFINPAWYGMPEWITARIRLSNLCATLMIALFGSLCACLR